MWVAGWFKETSPQTVQNCSEKQAAGTRELTSSFKLVVTHEEDIVSNAMLSRSYNCANSG